MVGEIYGIAAKNGWSVSMSVKNGIRSYDFQRKTLSGVAFSFTAEVKDDKVSSLTNEIVSFADAIHPDICAWEWMIKSGRWARPGICKLWRIWRTFAPKRGCWLATCLNCRVKSLFGLY
ncbi:hypothetical protein NXU97_25875 [Bacteroides xylanisolvens]|nr:hypothetical protein [Bacteroides xylanisolvens]